MNSVAQATSTSEWLDVVIIGAGLSGIGAAVHLQRECPGKRFAILEMRGAMGGTWDLFRYPGIRSDSDMYTLGYNFKPWTRPKAIADGHDIRAYIEETAAEFGVDRHIRYQHKVLSADWSSRSARWTLQVQRLDTGDIVHLQTRFIMCGAGYYNYDKGITPDFVDSDKFQGQIVHPQFWPQDLDYSGKRVVVIGSGATAVTLVPAMTDKAAQVTMLQRSPGYVMTLPQQDPFISGLRKVFAEPVVYGATRARNVLLGMAFYGFSRAYPERMRKFVMNQTRKQLGPQFDMKHFSPSYNPWDQRLCAVPDGDLFTAIRQGRADVVTDHIERFTQTGIRLKSGAELQADIIVTATGLDVQILGGMQLTLDGQPVKVSDKYYYKGAMLEDVPNLCMIFGYTNSSWTLKADLIAQYFCRVINHMDKQGFSQCTPRNNGYNTASEPFLNLSSSYVQRVIDQVPRQGNKRPWKLYQNYLLDYRMLKLGRVNERGLVFSNPVSHGYGYAVEPLSVTSV